MEQIVFEEFNLVPLKGVVVFPSARTHLDVGRPKSIKALENAMATNGLVFVSCQVDSGVSAPGQRDLYEIGTVILIKQLSKLPNNTVRVFVEGKYRAKMTKIHDRDDFLSVSVEKLSEVHQDELFSVAAVRVLKETFDTYKKLFRKLPAIEIEKILLETSAGVLVDKLAQVLPIPIEAKQSMLDILDIDERIIRFTKLLNYEKEIALLRGKIDHDVKVAIEEHQREFFLREQMKVIQKEMNNGENENSDSKELAEQITAVKMPSTVKKKALKELERYKLVSQTSPESAVIRHYLTWLIDLPWDKQSKAKIDLENVQTVLDQDHYGLEKIKERVTEYLAVQKLTKSMKAPILCLVGPPGVGKTSLAKSIATSVKRNFVRITLGGVRDEAEIYGHRRTYIGAMPGRIIQGIKKAGTNNPVVLLDEIDKMSSDFRGDPASAMLSVLDPEQNHAFSDHYIEEPFDLSKVMFIATANSLSTIPGPLRDRMEIIELSSYTEIEKFHIARNHLLNKQIKEHGLDKAKLTIADVAINEMIRHYTREAGVRNLERQIGTACRKIARKYADDPSRAYTIDKQNLQELLGKQKFDYRTIEPEDLIGVATGLAYTAFGGDTLQIEVSLSKGKGHLVLTGKLGDVMKESAQTALSYVRSRAAELGIDEDFNEKLDIHIHVPEGAVPKDGPSAGITMTTAIVSALTNKAVSKDIGMTGEVTLRGRVLPIGGLKEKSISAHRAGLKTIICPEKNEKDLDDIPAIVKDDVQFIFVRDVSEVLKLALV